MQLMFLNCFKCKTPRKFVLQSPFLISLLLLQEFLFYVLP